jgi:chromosome segregation ATPase
MTLERFHSRKKALFFSESSAPMTEHADVTPQEQEDRISEQTDQLQSEWAERERQIQEALRVEWRLKTEQGIHHDHLSDLSFLIATLEHTRTQLAALSAEHERVKHKNESRKRDFTNMKWAIEAADNKAAELEVKLAAAEAEHERLRTALQVLVEQWKKHDQSLEAALASPKPHVDSEFRGIQRTYRNCRNELTAALQQAEAHD